LQITPLEMSIPSSFENATICMFWFLGCNLQTCKPCSLTQASSYVIF
jgi:hypothetical protein